MRRDFVGFCVCLCTVVSVSIAGFSSTPHVPQAAEGVATASIVTPQPLVQASVYEPFSGPATQPLFIMQSTGVTEEDAVEPAEEDEENEQDEESVEEPAAEEESEAAEETETDNEPKVAEPEVEEEELIE